MNLADMRLPKSGKGVGLGVETASSESENRWPYGLMLTFNKEQIAKLKALVVAKVGDQVTVNAVGTVTAVRTSERQRGSADHTVEVQLEKVGVEYKKEKEQEKQIKELLD